MSEIPDFPPYNPENMERSVRKSFTDLIKHQSIYFIIFKQCLQSSAYKAVKSVTYCMDGQVFIILVRDG